MWKASELIRCKVSHGYLDIYAVVVLLRCAWLGNQGFLINVPLLSSPWVWNVSVGRVDLI